MSFRTLVSGRLNQYRAPQTNAASPTIFHAVVLDVIYDPKLLSEQDKQDLRQFVSNPEFVDTMPANSVVARIISNQQGATDDSASVVFPFFQSQFMLPIQAGEQISVIYDDYTYHGGILGRWISRTPEGQQVEDVNYTHGDRRFDPANNPSQQDAAQQRAQQNNQTSPPPPSFQNGGGNPESYSLKPSREEPNVNPFDTIVNESTACKLHTFEPVPRWTKRPQEFILQGMNNSLIMLGQDRVGPATRPDGNNDDRLKYSGTVDIVTGRGRIPLEPNQNSAPENKNTSALTVRNTRNNLETDKTPFVRNRQNNLSEGDPNFKSDAARLYLSMNTAGDKNFKLLDGDNGISYPDDTLKPTTQPTGPNDSVGSSYGILKADHVRIIARKATDPEIKGTLLLIKEGTKDSDLAYLYANEDGKIQVEGAEIYFGKATNKNEPYIKWSKFKETVDNLNNQINDLKTAFDSLVSAIQSAAPSSVCTPFSPDPAWSTLMGQAVSAKSALDGNMPSHKNATDDAVQNSKSRKIFGS